MIDNIKFRGYSKTRKRWFYGWLIRAEGNYQIYNQDLDYDIFALMNDRGSGIVVKESIGQYTGYKDKNGK